jgi:hypothetical protein
MINVDRDKIKAIVMIGLFKKNALQKGFTEGIFIKF